MQWELLIKDSEAQREIAQLTKTNKELEKSNKEVRLEMAKLEAQGKRNSTEWNGLRNVLQKNSTEISNNTKLIKANEDQLSMQNMTMQQLKKRYSELQIELYNTSKALDPKAWQNTKSKMDETKAAMDDMSGKTKKSESTLVSWGSAMKIGVMGALAGVGMKIVSVVADWFSLDKIIGSTQATGDRFEATMAGLNNTLDYVRRSLVTMDFSNFYENLKQAYEVAYKVSNQLDELFELNNSFKITDIGVKAQIEDLYEQMNNVNLSDEKRITAAREIERLTMQQAEKQKMINKQEADAYESLLLNQTKLNKAQLEFVVDKYIENKAAIDKAKELIELEDRVNNLKNRGASQSKASDARALSQTKEYEIAKANLQNFKTINAAFINSITETSKIVRGYESSNDEYVQKYVESRVKMLNVDVDAQNSLRRVSRSQNTLLKSMADDVISRQKEVSEQTKKQQEEGYKKEIELAEDSSKKKLIHIKELYKNGLMSQEAYNIWSASLEDELITTKIKINTVYSKSITDLEDQLISKQLERLDKLKDELDKIKKANEDALKKSIEVSGSKDQNQIAKDIEVIEEMYNSAAETASNAIESQKTDLKKLQDTYNSDVAALKQSLDLKMLTQEQYEIQLTKLKKEHQKKRRKIDLEGAMEALELAQQALSQLAEFSSALQEAEMSNLEAKKQKELKLYGNTADKRAEIEEKYEEQKLEIQKKYADIDMGIKINQALANGALAVMQAWATLPTPAAIAMSVIIGAITTAEVAAIVAQRNAIRNSSVNTSTSGSNTQRTVLSSQSSSDQQYSAPAINVPTAREPVAATSGVSNIQSLTRESNYKRTPESTAIEENTKAMHEVAKSLKEIKDTPIKAYTVLREQDAQREISDRIKSEGSL